MPTATEILEAFYADERIYMSQPPDQADSSILAKTLDANVQLYQSPDLPYGGVYEGVEGFLMWGKEMMSHFSRVDVQSPKVMGDGDDVVVLSTLNLTVRSTGKEWAKPFVQHVKVDLTKGKIVEMRPFYWDVKGLNEALAEK